MLLGAFYPTSSYAVAVNIIGKRFVEKTDNGEPLVMYYVNDGTYGSLNCAKYPSYIHLITPSPLKVSENIYFFYVQVFVQLVQIFKANVC